MTTALTVDAKVTAWITWCLATGCKNVIRNPTEGLLRHFCAERAHRMFGCFMARRRWNTVSA